MNKMKKSIRLQLEELAEENYRRFSAKLLPGIPNILGVRLPTLRKIAKQIAQENGLAYFQTASTESFEETMLQGMVIGYLKCSMEERFIQIARFVPKIDNWSVCDSFCAGLKYTKNEPQKMWDFLQPYFRSSAPYDIRFAVVMLIFYYINEEYLDEIFQRLDQIRHENYYVKMAVAWALSICYIRFPKPTLDYLNRSRTDDFTYNKALQKITESLKVLPNEKAYIKSLKR